MCSAVSVAEASRIVSQSERLPMMMPMSGAASVMCHSPDKFDGNGLSLVVQKAQSSNTALTAPALKCSLK
jgi:hypothetical protein